MTEFSNQNYTLVYLRHRTKRIASLYFSREKITVFSNCQLEEEYLVNETARGMLLEHSQVVTTSYEWQLYLELLLQKQKGNKLKIQ